MSVEQIFLDDLDLTWAQRAALLLRPRVSGEDAPLHLGHLTAIEYTRKRYLSESLWNEYLKFSVVRNPFARTESFYRYLGYDRMVTFEGFTTRYLPAALEFGHPWRWFLRPQVEYLFDDAGRLLVDHLVRLERINEDLPPILRSLGLDVTTVPHENTERRLNRRRMLQLRAQYFAHQRAVPRLFGQQKVRWTVGAREAVRNLYAPDFELLDQVA